MKQPHKHAELIKAWADGAHIQYRAVPGHGEWMDPPSQERLIWDKFAEYREKPEPKPDVVFGRNAYLDSDGYLLMDLLNKPNIRFTFDGETGKLKKAEVLE